MDFIIRQASHNDISQMCGLLADLFSVETDFNPDAEKQAAGLGLLLNDATGLSAVFVADIGDEIAGMCSVQTLISTAEGGPVGLLEDLIVRKDLRGNGIGTRLLSEIFLWCETKNISRVQLLRDIENRAAEMYYGKNGWSSTKLVCMRKFF